MIKIQHEDFIAEEIIRNAVVSGTGAIVTFLGIVRDDEIESMELEAYQEVAEKDLEEIRDAAMKEYHLLSVEIIHRTGLLRVGENIVLIVVSAGHRKEAFLGCEYIIDRLKKTTPIWKLEYRKDGTPWVEGEGVKTSRPD